MSVPNYFHALTVAAVIILLLGCDNPPSTTGHTPIVVPVVADGLSPRPATPERTSAISTFPCSTCHTTPQTAVSLDRPRNQHNYIHLQHASPEVMECATCHDYQQMDKLRTHTGASVDFNQSDQLCGQCHFQQRRDWLGGAHGKRLSNWNEERVAMNCTDCHDPHNPTFKKQWPVRHPNIPGANSMGVENP